MTDAGRSSSTDTGKLVQPAETAPRPIPDGDQPLLTIGVFDWNHPAMWLPRDLHKIVLYPDGTLTRVEAPTPTRLTLYTTTLSATQVDDLLAAADRAGLGDGVVLPPEPSPQEVVDGAWTIFTRRSEHGVGQVVVDQVGSDDGQPSNARRGVLAELLRMVPRPDEGAWQESSIERWVVESAQPMPDLTAADWPWLELDPNGLAWEYNLSGVRCAIVTMPDWDYSPDETADLEALEAGVFRRPLLPGESSCDDVFAWRQVLGLDAAMIIAPPGLP